MAEPENLVLEHLSSIRGEMAKLANWMETMSTEMTAMRHHLFGAITTQTAADTEVVEYPDSGKFGVTSRFDWSTMSGGIRHLARPEGSLGYFDGEE